MPNDDFEIRRAERFEQQGNEWHRAEVGILVERTIGEDIRLERYAEPITEQQMPMRGAIETLHGVVETQNFNHWRVVRHCRTKMGQAQDAPSRSQSTPRRLQKVRVDK